MRKTFVRYGFIIMMLLATKIVYSQVTVSGPSCVFPGIVYEYTITGSWDSVSTMSVCISGGQIADTILNNLCTDTVAPLYSVLVQWNDTTAGSVTVSSSKGTGNITVSVAKLLSPGLMDSTTNLQSIRDTVVPADILCSPGTDGSCSPSFTYQWQQSIDRINWTNIGGASDQNLSFTATLSKTNFFRRMITENVSGTIGYSDEAAVFVNLSDTSFGMINGFLEKKYPAIVCVHSSRQSGTDHENQLSILFKEQE